MTDPDRGLAALCLSTLVVLSMVAGTAAFAGVAAAANDAVRLHDSPQGADISGGDVSDGQTVYVSVTDGATSGGTATAEVANPNGDSFEISVFDDGSSSDDAPDDAVYWGTFTVSAGAETTDGSAATIGVDEYTSAMVSADLDSDGTGGGAAVVGDYTAPSVGSVILDESSGDVAVEFTTGERLGGDAAAVQVTVSGPGGATYQFDRSQFEESGSGPYTYTLSAAQPYDDGDGTYTATVATAKDAAGNDGGENGEGTGLTVSYDYSAGSDTTAPTISTVWFDATDGGDIELSFDADERLGGGADAIAVTVDGPSTTGVYTFDRTDFSEFAFEGGSYQYTLSTSQAFDDGDGVYVATVETARDAAGNDGGETGEGSGLTASYDTAGPSVVASDFSIVSGPGDESSLQLTAEYSAGMVQVQHLLSDGLGGGYDLTDAGVTSDTRIQATVTVDGEEPRVLIGNGRSVSWTRSQNADDTWTVTVTGTPTEADYTFPAPNEWDGTHQANTHADLALTYAADSLSAMPGDRRDRLDGLIFMTDAQSFSPPRYDDSGDSDAISFDVSAPHFAADGSVNYGFAEVFIPDSMLSHWGVAANGVTGTYNGQSRTTTITDVAGGVLAEISVHYSSGTAEFSVDATPPTAEAGSDVTVDAGASVDFDGSASSDDVAVTSYAWDFDGDGETDATGPTASHSFAESGSYDVALTVTDANGNTATDVVTVTVESSGSGGANGGDEGGDSERALPPVSVTHAGDRTDVHVREPTAGMSVDISPGPGSTGDLLPGRIDFDADTADPFTLNVSVDRSVPAGTPTPDRTDVGDAVGFLRLDHSVDDAHLSNVRLEVTVSWSVLTSGTNEHDLVLYRYHEGEWHALNTSVVKYTGDGAVLEAETPGLSVFAVGSVREPALSVTETELDASTVTAGESVTVATTLRNDGTADGTTVVTLTSDGTVRDSATVALAPGESATIDLSVSFETAGAYALAVDGSAVGPVTVEPVPTSTATTTPDSTVSPSPTSTATPTVTAAPSGTPAPTSTATPTPTASADGPSPGPAFVVLVVALTALAIARARE